MTFLHFFSAVSQKSCVKWVIAMYINFFCVCIKMTLPLRAIDLVSNVFKVIQFGMSYLTGRGGT